MEKADKLLDNHRRQVAIFKLLCNTFLRLNKIFTLPKETLLEILQFYSIKRT